MNIVITGGLGVNGVYVLRKLLAQGYAPIVYDYRLDYSLAGDIEGQFEAIQGDIGDLERLTAILKERNVQRLVHLAALMPPDAQKDPLNGFKVNALGTVYALEAARRAGVERVVFTSSRAAYGEIPPGEHRHPTYKPVPEDLPGRPVGVYDVTKLASEGMGLNYQRDFGLQFVALRFAAIFGPGKLARHGSVSLHGRILENALLGVPVRIPQGGDQRDDMMYVDDVGQAIVLATLKDDPKYSVYNIGSGVGHTLVEYAEAVKKVVPDADVQIGPGLDFFQAGVQTYAVFDITRAREDLGYEPKFDVESGVRAYVETMQRLGLQPQPTLDNVTG
jgi:UDP-glucose 4-epimerase